VGMTNIEAIIAIIAAAGTLLSELAAFLGLFISSRLTNFRIKQLEEKVEKHNSVMERVSVLETKVELMEKQYG
jgi:hypothetical protein